MMFDLFYDVMIYGNNCPCICKTSTHMYQESEIHC